MELVGDQEENFGDCEGSFSFGGEFWVGNGVLQVLSFQPHLVFLFKGFEILMVSGKHDLAGKFMSGESFIFDGIEEF